MSSQNNPEHHLRAVLECTQGILFLGTPLSGSGLATSAERLAKLIGLIKNTNPKILGVLRKDSEVLSRIQDAFHAMLRSRNSDGYAPINISCCYEQLPMSGIGEVSRFNIISIRHELRDTTF